MDRRKLNAPLRSVMIKVSTPPWKLLFSQNPYVSRGHPSVRDLPPRLQLLACLRLQYTDANCLRMAHFSAHLLLLLLLVRFLKYSPRLFAHNHLVQERTSAKDLRLLEQPTVVDRLVQGKGTKRLPEERLRR
ncbi:uncharacterized protein LOC142786388 [Rhipicephalus microplus]|uniref:uncharacterized protein LOC142786388 n=1 Tax=Rhipicephalus microplus TaxID=6941 RepID=UPI003F6B1A12